MRIAIAGGHGRVARRLSRALVEHGDVPVALVRTLEHVDDVVDDGAEAVVLDLERCNVNDVAQAVGGADAVVFAAGAGVGSGAPRKDSVDRGAAALLADAAHRAGVGRYVLVSSLGVEKVGGLGFPPLDMDPVFVAYLRAKAASEADLVRREIAWTVLRPGRLTDDEGTGRVRLAAAADSPSLGGSVSRDDVATVLVALAHAPTTAGQVLTLVAGDTHIPDAVAGLAAG
ncbi:NAD(P)H-binding protein [Cellulomonas composti]|uniref:NAD-dependent dehydratase n=1 Tax=Cellulomonas composti TaxID=266130 RepID=A0A511J7L9_9CELL|nr:NAD(P)H-binding protein [Cellulomonas composti]GEL93990.1 NAD-dependent dehydratase [Cellulomonas composti]